jgi:hypothetical protein
MEGELRQLNQAIQALSKVAGGTSSAGRRGKRTMSVAARKRIALAQRARWAKFHASRKKAAWQACTRGNGRVAARPFFHLHSSRITQLNANQMWSRIQHQDVSAFLAFYDHSASAFQQSGAFASQFGVGIFGSAQADGVGSGASVIELGTSSLTKTKASASHGCSGGNSKSRRHDRGCMAPAQTK